MTRNTENLIELVAVLKKLDKLFEIEESYRTKKFADILKMYDPKGFLKYMEEEREYDIEETLEEAKATLSDFEIRFMADPELKQRYLDVAIHFKKHFDEFAELGVLTPLVTKGGEEERIWNIYDTQPEDLQNLRTQLRYHELAFKVFKRANRPISYLQEMRADLYEAVQNADKLTNEYDEFLCSMTIYGHLDNNAEDITVYNIPYEQLKNFNKAALHYVG